MCELNIHTTHFIILYRMCVCVFACECFYTRVSLSSGIRGQYSCTVPTKPWSPSSKIPPCYCRLSYFLFSSRLIQNSIPGCFVRKKITIRDRVFESSKYSVSVHSCALVFLPSELGVACMCMHGISV